MSKVDKQPPKSLEYILKFDEPINLNIEEYSSGLYFIKVKSSKGVKTKPIMFN